MKDLFYIVNLSDVNGEWYRLHLTTTHHCLGGCGDYHTLLKTVKRLVKKYKTPDRITRVVARTTGKMSESTYEKYCEDYERYSDFEEEIESIVNETMQKVKESNPMFRTLQRLKRRGGESVKVENSETTEPPKKIVGTRPKILCRR